MEKLSRTKKNEMFNEYCFHSECGRYMEYLEQRVSELEFELLAEKIKNASDKITKDLKRGEPVLIC